MNRDKQHNHSRRVFQLFTLVALLTIIVAFCAVPGAAQELPTPSQPAQLGPFGMNTYFTGLERISRDGDDGITTLETLGRDAGVSWAREELSWGNLERKSKGSFDWNYFDRRLLEMARANYGIVGMLLTTPEWARVGDCAARLARYASAGVHPQNYWCPPANPQDFADYVRATVERYDGDGVNDAPGSPRVAVWQLWNEPNAWETWPGSPEEYGALLAAGYAAAKDADPSALVAIGGVYIFDGSWSDGHGHSDGLRFLDAAFKVPGAWRAFDALAVHPYMPDVAPDQPGIVPLVTMWGRITSARTWLATRTATYGGLLRPIWMSEIGWSTCSTQEADCYTAQTVNTSGDFDQERWPMERRPSSLDSASDIGLTGLIGKSEEQQADYLLRTAAIARSLGVSHINVFQFEDKFDGSLGNFWEEASVVGTKATGYRPKLAYAAFRVMTEQLGDAAFAGFGALHAYSYDPDGKRNPAARYDIRFLTSDNVLIDVLWQTDGKRSTVTLPREVGRSAELITRDGTQTAFPPTDGQLRFEVSEHPVYVRQTLPPALAVQPASVDLLTDIHSPPQSFTFSIANMGSGPLLWNATPDRSWILLGATSGQAWRSTLLVTLDPSGLSPGSFSGTISITSNGGTAQIPVRLIITDQVRRVFFPVAVR